jgi:hypothetical protein
MTGWTVWAADTGCTSCFLHREKNVWTAVESYCERKTGNAEEDLENFVHCNIYFKVYLIQILFIYNIFYTNIDNASLLWIKYSSFHFLSLLLEFTEYFQREATLPTYRHTSLIKSSVFTVNGGRDARHKDNLFSSPCTSDTFISADIIHKA